MQMHKMTLAHHLRFIRLVLKVGHILILLMTITTGVTALVVVQSMGSLVIIVTQKSGTSVSVPVGRSMIFCQQTMS